MAPAAQAGPTSEHLLPLAALLPPTPPHPPSHPHSPPADAVLKVAQRGITRLLLPQPHPHRRAAPAAGRQAAAAGGGRGGAGRGGGLAAVLTGSGVETAAVARMAHRGAVAVEAQPPPRRGNREQLAGGRTH